MYKLFVFITLLSIGFSTVAQDTVEQKAVKQAFTDYKSAILNDKGHEAASYTDSKTINYYNTALKNVKTADSLTIIKMSLLDKFTILTIRYRASKDQIKQFTGRSLLEYAISSGMVGKNSVTNNSIGHVEIIGNSATGQLLVNDNPTPFKLKFNKEAGNWKVDLTSVFPMAETAFNKMIKTSNIDENMYVMMVLSMMSSGQPKNNVWQPVLN